METTLVLRKSALEQRFEDAKESFNFEYGNTRYRLKDKDYYLGHGAENWRSQVAVLKLAEGEIEKSYLEDVVPSDWEAMRDNRNELLDYVSNSYEKATKMVIEAKERYKDIQDEVESKLEYMLQELHHHDVIDMEVDIISELVDTKVEYYMTDNTREVKGDYYTPPYVEGFFCIEYTITVYDEYGEIEQEIEGELKI